MGWIGWMDGLIDGWIISPGVFHPHNPPLDFHLCRFAIPPMAFQSDPNRLYITIPPASLNFLPHFFLGLAYVFSKSPFSPL
jgi:hypothetical protein